MFGRMQGNMKALVILLNAADECANEIDGETGVET